MHVVKKQKMYVNEGRKNVEENTRKIPKSKYRVHFHSAERRSSNKIDLITRLDIYICMSKLLSY